MLQAFTATAPESRLTYFFSFALGIVAGFLPPLLFHLVCAEETRSLWPLRYVFYSLSAVTSLAAALSSADILTLPGDYALGDSRAAMLFVGGVLGIAVLARSRRTLSPVERRQKQWTLLLLAVLSIAAVINIVWPGPFAGVLPDYVLFLIFCVILYYKERLVFFDLFLKRGAFFVLTLSGLTLLFAVSPRLFDGAAEQWSRPWIAALFVTPFWMATPWIHSRLMRGIDRFCLRRAYSREEAERRFAHNLQLCIGEEDLRVRAAHTAGEIFRSHAEVVFAEGAGSPRELPGGLMAHLARQGNLLGWIAVAPQPGYPFLSDDLRLVQSLAKTLSIALENIRLRERERHLRGLAARAELKALRTQINPHFLFNALNAIAGLIPLQPEVADETVERLAEVFRYTLRKSEHEWVRMEEELDFVRAYVRIEQARFGERLNVSFDIDPATLPICIPAITIQPLVENAIRHGISVLPGLGIVRLQTSLKEDVLYVEIVDNGPGFPAGGKISPGMALRNITERLKGYYGNSAQLGWSNEHGGTRVFLVIPVTILNGSASA
jgi:signal transduction histidine kinase